MTDALTRDFDPQPDFDAARLIVGVTPLLYILPMRSPSGVESRVMLLGDFAAWGELVTALVRADWEFAPHVPFGTPEAGS